MSLSTSVNQVWAQPVLSILRFVVGLCFFEHGLSKLFGFPHVAMFDHLHLFSLIGLQGVIELIGGALVCVGLFTRPAAFILSGDMAVAYFMAHFPKNFFPDVNGGDAAILYCFLFFYIFFAGPGPWSLDHAVRRAAFAEEAPLAAESRRA
jgi:putative oxidoreductase